MCEIHPNRELRLFCGRCGVVVCRDCCVMLHRGHPCDTAARAARNYATTLREALDKTQPVAKEASLTLGRLQHLEIRIKVSFHLNFVIYSRTPIFRTPVIRIANYSDHFEK